MTAGDVEVAITTNRGLGCNIFDGVDDYVEIPHNAAQLGANLSNGFTISAWINPRSVGETNGKIIDKSDGAGSSGTNGFTILMGSGGSINKLALYINAGTAGLSTNNFPFGTWTHALVTISSGQLANFYANGVLSGTANQNLVQAISTITTTNAPRIGNRSGATDRTFDGSIKDVKMWNRVLTSQEIENEYAGQHTGGGCIHYFRLNGDYTDKGSVGVTATNSGSVPAIVDDKIAEVVKAQRTATGMSGAFMMCKGAGGQVINVAIQKT